MGLPVAPDTIAKHWRELCKLAKVRQLPLKAARSSSVTVMRNLGFPDSAVSAWHGHSEEVMKSSYTAVTNNELAAIDVRAFAALHPEA